jgi:hypothetical protein
MAGGVPDVRQEYDVFLFPSADDVCIIPLHRNIMGLSATGVRFAG